MAIRLRRKFAVGSVFLAYFWSGNMVGLARAQAAEAELRQIPFLPPHSDMAPGDSLASRSLR